MPTVTAKPLATSTATQTSQMRVAGLMAKVDLVWGKDWAQTVDLLKQANKLDPTDSTINDKLYVAMYNYGAYYSTAGKKADAIMWFQYALELKPDGAEAKSGLLSLTPTATPTVFPPLKTFLGIWHNIDDNTRSWTKVEITSEGDQFIAHFWGRCHPTDCDAGISMVTYKGSPVLMFKNDGFATRNQTLGFVKATNILQVTTITHFTDNSGRTDFTSVDFFRK
ncbi:MAG: hypothetical protein HZB53_06805 [Chloroflexi bacterium]|nr:hypothetical protein [Chloroflexota bacterium]